MSKTYTTMLGDMWDLIAKRTLGNEMYMDRLIKSNLKCRHIFIFPAGVVLTIPAITDTPISSLPPWKRSSTA